MNEWADVEIRVRFTLTMQLSFRKLSGDRCRFSRIIPPSPLEQSF
ncbi:hypothetical protein ABER99_24440 [Paenibacillus glucanolyticus]|nr:MULTISPECIES: hypothetical protein [Paenibacillus]